MTKLNAFYVLLWFYLNKVIKFCHLIEESRFYLVNLFLLVIWSSIFINDYGKLYMFKLDEVVNERDAGDEEGNGFY